MLYRNTLLMFSKQLRMRDIDAHGNTLCEMCRTLHIGGHMMQGSGVNPTDAIAMLMQTPPFFLWEQRHRPLCCQFWCCAFRSST